MDRLRKLALPLLLFAYLCNFFMMSKVDGFPMEEALGSFIILGLVFSPIAYFVSRRSEWISPRLQSQTREVFLISLLFLYLSIALMFGSASVVALLPESMVGEATTEVVAVLFKVIVFVVVPFTCYRILYGFTWRDFGLVQSWSAAFSKSNVVIFVTMSALFMVLQWFGGRAAAPIRDGAFSSPELLLGLPLAFAWLLIEVGLVEEFFFRSLVQDRLAGLMKSEWLGIAIASLLFGIAHAPGMYFRGAGDVEGLGSNPSFLMCMGYCIAVQSAAGIPFAIIWSKTRNLWLVMAIHASGDLLSNFPSLVKAFGW